MAETTKKNILVPVPGVRTARKVDLGFFVDSLKNLGFYEEQGCGGDCELRSQINLHLKHSIYTLELIS